MMEFTMNNYTTLASLEKNHSAFEADFEVACRRHMYENGLGLPDHQPLIKDNEIHRYSSDSKQNELDEWYRVFAGFTSNNKPFLRCVYGSWSNTAKKFIFSSTDNQENYTSEERANIIEILEDQKKEDEKKLTERHDKIAKEAARIWKDSMASPPRDTVLPSSKKYALYPKMKGIDAIGARYDSYPHGNHPALVICLQNIEGEIRSIQYIWVDDNGKVEKRFMKDGEKRGCFYIIGSNTQEVFDRSSIIIVEGYATGISVYEATKRTVPVIVAFDAGNIEPVIENIRRKFADISITIAGDDDKEKEGNGKQNTGKEAANKAAKKFGCAIVFPTFLKGRDKDKNGKYYSDFNDLHQHYGIDEVRKQIETASTISITQEIVKSTPNNLLKEEPCNSFDLSLLPPALSNYIQSVCSTTEAHPIMITASVLATASAFIGKRYNIPEGEYFQPLYPNLWILCITRSGQFKSTALNKGARLALRKNKKINENIRSLQETLKKENDGDRKKDIVEQITRISQSNVILPNKITAEAFLEHLSQGNQGVVLSNEFAGWLQNLEKSNNVDLKAIYTELYDVPGSYRYKTRTQGDLTLIEPYFSIVGVSNLPWIKQQIKPNDVASGFFARFLLFTPPFKNIIPSALPKHQTPVDCGAEKRVEDILNSLDDTRSYTLSKEAKNLFETAHADLYERIKIYSVKCQELLEPYVKRWSPYILKIAIIMQVFIDEKAVQISPDAIQAARALLEPAIKSTAHLFEGELGESEHQRKCRILLEGLRKKAKGGPLRRQAIMSSKILEGGSKEYDYILGTLIEQGEVILEERLPKNDSLYIIKDNKL